MLLAVDIGNTNIKIGFFDGDRLVSCTSFATGSLLPTDDGQLENVTAAIVCSVVPDANEGVTQRIRELTRVTPVAVSNDMDLGLEIVYEPPSSLGTDRLVNAFAAAALYGTPALVCSLGTATTIDLVVEGRFRGGVIAPGMALMANSLHSETAALPNVVPAVPEMLIGTSTESAIRSGVFYGYVSMLEGLIERFRRESGPAKVIATGGGASVLAGHTEIFDVLDAELVLKGLQRIHRRLFH